MSHTPPWQQFKRRYRTIDGVRLHWLESGPQGSGPPLVLLHGLFDSHRTWDAVAPALAQRRRVLVPDLPGCGLSARPDATYELGWHADIMAQWLRALGESQVDIVGHSYGGGVAQMLLLQRPMPLRRMVLVASGGLGRDVAFWLRLASIPWVVERLGQPFMRNGTRVFLSAVGRGVSKQHIAHLSAMNSSRGSARAFSRTVRDVIDWRGQRRAFFERCDEVQLPSTAVFWGSDDPIIPISHGHGLVDAFRGITFKRFEHCGHYLHHESGPAFVAALEAFLDDPSVPVMHLPVERQRRRA